MNKLIYCKCGCGKKLLQKDNRNRIRFFISGHNGRGIINPEKYITIPCCYCGKSLNRLKCQLKDGRNPVCNKNCQYKYTAKKFRGKGSVLFKDGTSIGNNGYITEVIWGHPLADNRGRVLKHRRIAFDHIGFLPKGCIIHHIDGNRLNNAIKNLSVWNQSDHVKFHFKCPVKTNFIPISSFRGLASSLYV